MDKTIATILVLVSVGVGALALRAQGANDRREEVFAADRAFNRAVAARDVPAFRALVADSARFFSGDGSVAAGRDEVARGWAPLMAADRRVELSWEPRTADVSAGGDLAYTTGDFNLRVLDGSVPPQHGRYVTIWRRNGEGWQAVLDIGTRPAPAAKQ